MTLFDSSLYAKEKKYVTRAVAQQPLWVCVNNTAPCFTAKFMTKTQPLHYPERVRRAAAAAKPVPGVPPEGQRMQPQPPF